MSNWNKITLFKFQQVEAIQADKVMPDLDKVLWSTCAVFDYTEYQLDNMNPSKVGRLTTKMTRIFETPFTPKPFKRIGKYFINYDVAQVTLGQYIELSFFLSANPIQNAHYVVASVSNKLFRKNEASEHRKKADYFLRRPITKIMGSLALIIERFTAFNKEYSALFGLDREVNGDVQADPFNKRYGWIYSATQVAEYERIPLEQAFRLPVRQAFNDLAYLKAKVKYEADLIKQN